jgi:hypothetical protein
LLRNIENLFEKQSRKAKLTEIPEKNMLFFELSMMEGARLQEFFEVIAVLIESSEYKNTSSAAALFLNRK